MENTNLGIEISSEVIKTEKPNRIIRYDSVPQKPKNEEVENEKEFHWYSPGIGSFLAKNPVKAKDFTQRRDTNV